MCSDDTTVRIPLRARDGSVRAYALIDAADTTRVNQWRWHLDSDGYAARCIWVDQRVRKIRMHRDLLGLTPKDEVEVDHINRQKLDNRHSNLRMGPYGLNQQNAPAYVGKTSQYRGVCWGKTHGKRIAYVRSQGRLHHLGLFSSESEAAEAARVARSNLLPYSID